MTVKDLISTVTCDLYITFGEDPNNVLPDIKIKASVNPDEVLCDNILNHEVHLTTAIDDAIYISLFLDN